MIDNQMKELYSFISLKIKKRNLLFFIFILSEVFIWSQQFNDILLENKDVFNCSFKKNNDSISHNYIKQRAILMSNVKWCPKSDIPNNLGYFPQGEIIMGLPYSSVKELQKFIGLDVSIYTFLTAVNNPYSLLYSEDVAKGNHCYLGGTYNGINSHTFYGTVCSSFTAFCYGENYNYTSFNYRNELVPNYYQKSDQSLETLEVGNLFWCPGHVALITEVEKDSQNNIRRIELFESGGTKVYSIDYTPTSFLKRMSGNGNPKNKAYLYRNKLVETSVGKDYEFKKDDVQLIFDNLSIGNSEICTWFGDRPCLGEWDKLMINFNKQHYDKIIISLNEEVIDTLDISNMEHSIEYEIKSKGIYKAQLASDTIVSPIYTSFEIIDTTTKIRQNDDGTFEVLFADNSDPEIVFWVDKTGDQLSFPITVSSEAKKSGKIVIKPCARKDRILRVIYRGNYGRAINKPDYLCRE